MGKKFQNEPGSKQADKKNKRIRMAYSLNNHQPVVCTIVSDEPLFYMCEDVSAEDIFMEEDGIFYDDALVDMPVETADALEQEMAMLRRKMEAYDKISSTCVRSDDERMQQFLVDSLFLTGEGTTDTAKEFDLFKTLCESRYADSLYQFAIQNGVSIEYSPETKSVSYDIEASRIFINKHLNEIDQLLLVAQELRRVWMDKKEALKSPLKYHPDQAVLVNRAQRADLATAVIRTAWELKLKGHENFWKRIENSPFSDLGRAFAREACVDFRTLNNGKAAAAVFESWFLSERCNVEDKKLVQLMLNDQHQYIFDAKQPDEQVLISFIHKLGEQPYGKNYLAAYAHMILSDPIFMEVRDRANANFLWFIKFERSFNQAERELNEMEQPLHFNDPKSVSGIKSELFDIHRTQIEDTIDGNTQQQNSNIIHVAFGNTTLSENKNSFRE